MIPAGVFNQGIDAMIVEVRVTSGDLQASIYPAGTVNIEVDWGDGNSNTYTTPGIITHNYTSAGTYMVKITGSMTGWGSSAFDPNRNKVYSIRSWGKLGITSIQYGFYYMMNIEHVATPPSEINDMRFAFAYAPNFNGDISGWNVSNVTFMTGMFVNATSFNQDISGWNVSNVTDMTNMFLNATSFNQDLSGWCVKNIPMEPANFAIDTPSWTLPKPVWGTCP